MRRIPPLPALSTAPLPALVPAPFPALVLALTLALALAGCSVPDRSDLMPQPAPGASGTQTVVTLGDSVPAGTACDCDPFPDVYAGLLTPPARSINESRAGFTSADVRDQLSDSGVRAAIGSATVVLIMAGANDLADAFGDEQDDVAYRNAAAEVEQNVVATVAAIHQTDPGTVTVLVIGYWNVVKDGEVGLATYGTDGERSAVTATQYANQALRQAAADSGARYLPTVTVFKGDQRNQDPTALLAADGDHPNAQGHLAIAQALLAALPDG